MGAKHPGPPFDRAVGMVYLIITDGCTPRRGLFTLFLATAAEPGLKFDGSIL